MNLNMVKPEQFDHFHLVYHFTVSLNTILYFLLLMNTWKFHLLICQRVGPVWSIFISFVYTGLVSEHS